MKKLLLALSFLIVANIGFSKSVVIDGLKYTLRGENINVYASVKVADKEKLSPNVIIPAKIVIDGREYPVTEVENGAFKNCKNVETIETPNSIINYGYLAFVNCSSLKSIVMADNAVAKIYSGNYGYDGGGIFQGCTSLQSVKGQTIPYPKYILFETFCQTDGVPFYETIEKIGALNMMQLESSVPFSKYYADYVKTPIENWQKRKEYETLAQWESRVSEDNRKKMINEYALEARERYIRENAPVSLHGTLEKYDSEYGFFSINTLKMGTLYARVPVELREKFESNWKNVKINPTYGILDDHIAVLDCKFVLDGNEYESVRKYEEDNLSELTASITPIAALREYEQMLASELNGNRTIRIEPDIIDIDIPVSGNEAPNTFAVIIGNEAYQRVAPVDYAMNDARIFAKYCNRTLGLPENNIRTYYNATFGDIVAAMEDIRNISKAYSGNINVIFYYAGHGVPNESNRNAFILPVDANGNQTDVCYPLSKLYEELGGLNANSVVAFIDACFSGSLRGDGLLASVRGVMVKPREIPASGKLVVLSAASSDQSALPYHEKNHGLFTYHLLKKLYDTKGSVTIGELSDYITEEVGKQSIVEARKLQTPTVKWSSELNDTWRQIQLK